MKSRITIEVDFENGNEPIIQIISKVSDDVRDNLIKAFYQKLGSSSWCKIVFNAHHTDHEHPENDFKRISITPIPELKLKEEADIMLEQHRLRLDWDERMEKK